ncbi:MAG: 1-deoxy-D-xylulose-5-phosphate reductoisomerase [Candidatus Omnitrophota bacterium]|jgi:1-deoxy-D-xylulose-5-phosphate reductoisomerase
MIRKIAILGSTGSIGVNALDVISRFTGGKFEVVALSADTNIKLLSQQSRRFRPKVVSVSDPELVNSLEKQVPRSTKVLSGTDGLNAIVSRKDVDTVVFAISGSACLMPLVTAIKNRKRIALANKESIVSAGEIVMRLARKYGVNIIPIDSEHSAIFQCLEGRMEALRKVYLTGSGGPLLNLPAKKFNGLSQKFILKHPRWRMGKKISIDSATMMNKGLEIIEAKWLFDLDQSAIEVLIHPEAIIHSMVELVDGSVFAQLGVPDMRLPIQYAITYPSRFKGIVKRLDFSENPELTFRRPDMDKFPCLGLARKALKAGGADPAVLNAADEEAVKCYLEGRIKFSSIPCVIEKVLGRYKRSYKEEVTINDILDAERWAKEEARRLCYH